VIPASLAAAGAALIVCAAAWGHGYMTGRDSRGDEVAQLVAAGESQTAIARRTTEEVAHVQKLYVDAWTRARDAARREWLRIQAAGGASGVPALCAQPSSTPEPASGPVARAGDQTGATLVHDLLAALEAGEGLQARLSLCQRELQVCAAMR
jgi:hypothetical protein